MIQLVVEGFLIWKLMEEVNTTKCMTNVVFRKKKNVWQMYKDQNYDLIIKVVDYNFYKLKKKKKRYTKLGVVWICYFHHP